MKVKVFTTQEISDIVAARESAISAFKALTKPLAIFRNAYTSVSKACKRQPEDPPRPLLVMSSHRYSHFDSVADLAEQLDAGIYRDTVESLSLRETIPRLILDKIIFSGVQWDKKALTKAMKQLSMTKYFPLAAVLSSASMVSGYYDSSKPAKVFVKTKFNNGVTSSRTISDKLKVYLTWIEQAIFDETKSKSLPFIVDAIEEAIKATSCPPKSAPWIAETVDLKVTILASGTVTVTYKDPKVVDSINALFRKQDPVYRRYIERL